MGVEGFGSVDDVILELGVEFLQNGLGEAGADVAHRLVLLGGSVVAGEQEGAVDGGALPSAKVGA